MTIRLCILALIITAVAPAWAEDRYESPTERYIRKIQERDWEAIRAAEVAREAERRQQREREETEHDAEEDARARCHYGAGGC